MGAKPGRRRAGRHGLFVTLKAVLFDMDGTLIDSDPVHASVFIDFLAARGVTIDQTDYTSRIHGRQNREIFAELLPHEDPRAMDEAKEAAFRARVDSDFPVVPGVWDLLDRLRDSALRLGVVTNACGANLDAVLDALDMGGRFHHRVSSDDVAHGKPDPALYRHALDALGAAPDEALAFEDSPAGIASARGAGLKVIGVATSLSPAKLLELGAAHAIGDFTDPSLTQHLAIPEGANP